MRKVQGRRSIGLGHNGASRQGWVSARYCQQAHSPAAFEMVSPESLRGPGGEVRHSASGHGTCRQASTCWGSKVARGARAYPVEGEYLGEHICVVLMSIGSREPLEALVRGGVLGSSCWAMLGASFARGVIMNVMYACLSCCEASDDYRDRVVVGPEGESGGGTSLAVVALLLPRW
jgi:hypothetical protein